LKDYLKQNFGIVSGATWGQGDFSGDGKVDYSDLQMMMGAFGNRETSPAANTPEPATGLSLLVLGGLGVLARGKKR